MDIFCAILDCALRGFPLHFLFGCKENGRVKEESIQCCLRGAGLRYLSAVQMATWFDLITCMRCTTAAGSAAFNLLLISAVCIVAVPEGQSKSISEFSVFLWTAFMSVFAYFWMLVVYKFWTPDEVTILEAVLTLLFLPLLVGVAYVLDRKPWKPKTEEGSDGAVLTRPQLYQVHVSVLVFLCRLPACLKVVDHLCACSVLHITVLHRIHAVLLN